jgi:hypothetical protein
MALKSASSRSSNEMSYVESNPCSEVIGTAEQRTSLGSRKQTSRNWPFVGFYERMSR